MVTQSPFSLFQTFLQGLPAPTLAPPPWAIEEGQRRLVLLLNHILQQEPEALARLENLARWLKEYLWLAGTAAGCVQARRLCAGCDAGLSPV